MPKKNRTIEASNQHRDPTDPTDLTLPEGQATESSDVNSVYSMDRKTGTLYIGGTAHAGTVVVRDLAGVARITITAETSELEPGLKPGNDFRHVIVRNSSGVVVASIDNTGCVSLGADGQAGRMHVRNGDGVSTIELAGDGSLRLGANGQTGRMDVRNSSGESTIGLDGQTGDIQLLGADCAEDFDLAPSVVGTPGMVMVLDERGLLMPCDTEFDRRVAGVLSGAGNFRPGITLDRRFDSEGRAPLALVGKVFCWVDANYGGVTVGDLLTTSCTTGHARVVQRPLDAPGAVIGKALQCLDSGRALIPILVALQ